MLRRRQTKTLAVPSKSQAGHQVKVKTDHVSGGESLLENRVCWFSPVRSMSASMS